MPVRKEYMLRQIVGEMPGTFTAADVAAKTANYGRVMSIREVAGLLRAYGLTVQVGFDKVQRGALYKEKVI